MTNRLTNNSRSTRTNNGPWKPIHTAWTGPTRRASNNLSDEDYCKQLKKIITDAITSPDTNSVTKLLNAKGKIEKFCSKNTPEGRKLQYKVKELHAVLRDGILEDIYDPRKGPKQHAGEYITTIERFFTTTVPTLPGTQIISTDDLAREDLNENSGATWNNVHISYFRIGAKNGYDRPILTTLLSNRNKGILATTLEQMMENRRHKNSRQQPRAVDPFSATSPPGTRPRPWSNSDPSNRKRDRFYSTEMDNKSNKRPSTDSSSVSAYDSGSDRSTSSTSTTRRSKHDRTSTYTRSKDEANTTEEIEDEETKRMRTRLETLEKAITQNEQDLEMRRQRAREKVKAELTAQLKAKEKKLAEQEKEKLALEIEEKEAQKQKQEILLASISSSSSSSSNEQTTTTSGPNTTLLPPPAERGTSTDSDCQVIDKEQASEQDEDSTEDNTPLANRTLQFPGTPPKNNADEPHPVPEQTRTQNEQQRISSPPYSPPPESDPYNNE